jgi:hypothetical protein
VLFDEIRYFFYITNRRDLAWDEVVQDAHERCNQENVIEQLKNGVNAMRVPVNDLNSNWAYMVHGGAGLESQILIRVNGAQSRAWAAVGEDGVPELFGRRALAAHSNHPRGTEDHLSCPGLSQLAQGLVRAMGTTPSAGSDLSYSQFDQQVCP